MAIFGGPKKPSEQGKMKKMATIAHFLSFFEVKKGPVYQLKFDFRKKERILSYDLGKNLEKYRRKKGQYTSVNLIFVNF